MSDRLMDTWTPEQRAESDFDMGGNQSTNPYEEGTKEHRKYAWKIHELAHPAQTEYLKSLYKKVS